MGKALKPLVVVLLVLSIVSLVLGIMLFSKRTVLKTRVLTHEQAVVTIAQKLRFEGLKAEDLKKVETMGKALDSVSAAADVQYEDLQNKIKDLETTRQELASTKDELTATKTELADVQAKIPALEDTIAQKEAELAQAKGSIDQLEQDKTALQTQIDGLNDQIVKSEEDMRDCQDEVSTLKQVIDKMEVEQGGRKMLPPGLTGKVTVVNPTWNFVVLDIGSDSGVVPNAELMVHREDRLIGKVKISSVQKKMSVAEILQDWALDPVREGDNVLF